MKNLKESLLDVFHQLKARDMVSESSNLSEEEKNLLQSVGNTLDRMQELTERISEYQQIIDNMDIDSLDYAGTEELGVYMGKVEILEEFL